MSTMQAVRIHQYGGPEVLTYQTAPRPQPGPGEVLIRVHATTVNPFDAAVRAGYMAGYFNYNLPLIPGEDVSGTIEELGPGVSGFQKGDEVFTRAGVFRDGAYAEYTLAFAADVVAKPCSLDHIQAAALPHVTLTAWQALFGLADLKAGQTALIHGAAGGVGHVAVQLAKWAGARVIGTAGSNYDLLASLGVDQAINYQTTHFDEVVSGVDMVLDTIGGETQERSWGVLKPGGMLVSVIQPPDMEKAAAHGVRAAMVSSGPQVGPTLSQAARLVEEGKLRPIVSAVLPLSEVRTAHQMIEGRHTRGKIVLQVQ